LDRSRITKVLDEIECALMDEGGVYGRAYPEESRVRLPSLFSPLTASYEEANRIKSAEPITFVIGNPPYKEKAKGRTRRKHAQTPASKNLHRSGR
jgi:hypothetical protein